MGTMSYPSDPIINGASTIQTSTFACIAADYKAVTHKQAMKYTEDKEAFKYFPKTDLPGWSFFIRADLTGASSNLRNLIGIRTQVISAQHKAYATGGDSVFRVVDHEVEVSNWVPGQRNLADGTIATRWKLYRVLMTLSLDPETGSFYIDQGEQRSLEETTGFLLRRVGGSNPTLVPAMNAIAGMHPLE